MNIFGSLLGEALRVSVTPHGQMNTPWQSPQGVAQRPAVPHLTPEEADMLRNTGRVVTFTWNGQRFGPFPDLESADIAWAEALADEGYVEPRWWNFSRRNEQRPSKRALELLRERRVMG